MHPREGWQADGSGRRHGLFGDGRPAGASSPGGGLPSGGLPSGGLPAGVSRRSFLQRAGAAGLLAGGGGALLSACAPALAGGAGIPLPRRDNPVQWPVFAANKPIASGLPAETGATLQVFNWVAYVNQAVLNSFAKKHKCKVALTNFTTMDEAMSKLRSGLKFDVFMGVTADVLGQLVESRLIQPLNHSYLPDITQAWPEFTNPFYDQQWQYTVPYTIYTTGMAWRKDLVHENPYAMKNPWALPWQAKYKGKVAILDDYREAISLGLMKNGLYDLNTTSRSQIDLARRSLQELIGLVNVHMNNNDYSEVPTGQTWIHHAWSGDIAAAAAYVPKGVPVEAVGYWFPPDGKGPVANDTLTVLRAATNPVLAHQFLNYMLQLPNVLENISFNGYMQPLTKVTPQLLIKEQLLPPSLASTAVLPSYFRRGLGELQLAVDTDALWQQAWLVASNGI